MNRQRGQSSSKTRALLGFIEGCLVTAEVLAHWPRNFRSVHVFCCFYTRPQFLTATGEMDFKS